MSSNTATTRPTTGLIRVQPPRVFTGTWQQAHESAISGNEPVFMPVPHYVDDRGWSLMNMMQGVLGPAGQVNFSVQYPGVIKAWHRHDKQTDFWCCLMGHLKVGVYRESDGAAWMTITGEKKPGVLIIPPPLWHGAACVGSESAGLLYYVTHSYDSAHPDEHRRPFDSVEGFPWNTRHG